MSKKISLIFLLVLASAAVMGQTVDKKAYERYINPELYGQMLDGTYWQGKKKITAKIKYVPPVEYQDPAVPLVIDKGDGEETLPKSKINAFEVNGRTIVPEDLGDSVVWVMLVNEGAIRETILFTPVPRQAPEYYKINHLVTNTLTHQGYFVGSLAINFHKSMAALTADYAELSQKIANREKGYRFIDYKRIIAEYNKWFQEQYPKRIKYIHGTPDFEAIIEAETNRF
ncbi:MAG TPA: hypothetical protein ENJ39_01075 [Flammeovirgaceae bacterium]|nr:hypothetical protein [Flammeovirgaceae bacterium]